MNLETIWIAPNGGGGSGPSRGAPTPAPAVGAVQIVSRFTEPSLAAMSERRGLVVQTRLEDHEGGLA